MFIFLDGLCLNPCFWPASPRQRVSSIWLVFWHRGFWLRSAPKTVNHKNPRIFLTYVPPYLSSAAYLPLPLPTTTCRCLPLPATKSLPATTCNYLLLSATTSTCHYLPLPATACQCLPLPVSIWPSATTSTGHHLQIPTYPQTLSLRLHRLIWYNRPGCQTNLNRLLLEDPFRQRISSIWFVFWNPCFWATSPPQNVKKIAEKVRIVLFLDLFANCNQETYIDIDMYVYS